MDSDNSWPAYDGNNGILDEQGQDVWNQFVADLYHPPIPAAHKTQPESPHTFAAGMPPQAQYPHIGMTQNPQYSQFGTTSNAQYSQLDLEDAEDVPTHTSPNAYTTDRNTQSLADMVRAMPQVNPTTRRWSPERPPKMLEQSPYTIEDQGEFGYHGSFHPELYHLQDPNEQRALDDYTTPNTATDYTLNYGQTGTPHYHPPQQTTALASPHHESATAPLSSFGSSPASAHLHSQPTLATQGLPRKAKQQRVMCICTICDCIKMYPLRTPIVHVNVRSWSHGGGITDLDEDSTVVVPDAKRTRKTMSLWSKDVDTGVKYT
ncbi:hypothetical protein LTR49_003671 [Elasticomyces elasticus]|nr:hypothetical protein LTR49_003671 [Elasticomyces elasticus]